MFEEWYRSNFGNEINFKTFQKDIEEKNKFLIKNKDVDFSTSDIKFFLKITSDSYREGAYLLKSFLYNEKRVMDLIQLCEESSLNIVDSLIIAIGHYLSLEEISLDEESLFKDLPKKCEENKFEVVLFKHFPIRFFENSSWPGVRVFNMLCCIYQKMDMDTPPHFFNETYNLPTILMVLFWHFYQNILPFLTGMMGSKKIIIISF